MIPFLSHSPNQTSEESSCCPTFQFVIPAQCDTHFNNPDFTTCTILYLIGWLVFTNVQLLGQLCATEQCAIRETILQVRLCSAQ